MTDEFTLATSTSAATTTKPMTMFWLIKATPEWLAMPPRGAGGRFAFVAAVLQPALKKYPQVSLRYFDAEAYTAQCSDVMMWTVHSTAQYHALVEDLRETAFWDRYFHIQQIVPTLEDQYADHYDVERASS